MEPKFSSNVASEISIKKFRTLKVYRLLALHLLNVVIVSLSVTPISQAQTASLPPTQAAQEGLRRQEERLKEQLQQQTAPQDVLRPESKEIVTTSLPEESPCFEIEEFRFTGKNASRFAWLQTVLTPYQGRCIGVEGVSRLASLLDAKLIEWGYATTKISLPAQNLSSGILTFNINVGRVSAVRVVKAGTNVPDDAWGMAFPHLHGHFR